MCQNTRNERARAQEEANTNNSKQIRPTELTLPAQPWCRCWKRQMMLHHRPRWADEERQRPMQPRSAGLPRGRRPSCSYGRAYCLLAHVSNDLLRPPTLYNVSCSSVNVAAFDAQRYRQRCQRMQWVEAAVETLDEANDGQVRA